MPERKSLAAGEAIKSFEKSDISVTVIKTGKGGAQERDPETKRFVTETKRLVSGHILAASEDGETVFITTVDGQKCSATKAAK